MKKDTSSIPSLMVDDRTVISAKEKACVQYLMTSFNLSLLLRT